MGCRSLLILLVVVSRLAGLNGQSVATLRISGPDAQPLPGVEVYVDETGELRQTGPEGTARLRLPAELDSLSVTIFAPDYTTLRRRVGEGITEVQLRALEQNLSAVTVLARVREREALDRLRAVEGTAIYAGRKTEVVSLDALTVNLATNQARQIYAEVSGLNIYENDDAGLQLNIGGRGLDPNRSASFNTRQNGYDISADVLGYPESYYTPPAEALARIQVVRGAAGLQYGTQFGGLVNFVFREPKRDDPIHLLSRQTVGSNGLFTSFNSLSGQVGAVGYYGFYNRKRGDGFRLNSGFSSHNAFLHLDLAAGPSTQISFEYTYLDYLAQQAGGLTDAQFYRDPFVSNRARNWFAVDWQLFSLRLDQRIGTHTNLSVNFFGLDAARRAVGFRTNRVSQVDDPNAPRDLLIGEFRNGGMETRLLHRYTLGGQSAVALLGVKYYRAENAAVQGPGTAAADADFTLASNEFPDYPDQSDFRFPNRNLAVFGEHIFYLDEHLSLTPGARYEYIRTASEGNYQRVDFDLAGNPIRDRSFRDDRTFSRSLLLLGLGLSYQPERGPEWFANLSQNYRSVTFNDIRTINPSFQVDPDIGDERGWTADAGLRGRSGRLSYTANLFLLRYGNRLGEVLTPEIRANADGEERRTGRIVRLRTNVGAARIYGLESLLEYRLLDRQSEDRPDYRLTAFANTSLTHSRYGESRIAGVEGNEVEFIPFLNSRGGLRFAYGQLAGSLQYSYLSRQYTDASNAEQDRNDNQSGIIGSIPAYGVADLSLSYRYRWLTVESGMNNLTDARYFTRRATGYPGPGIIPSAPRTFYLTLAFAFGGTH